MVSTEIGGGVSKFVGRVEKHFGKKPFLVASAPGRMDFLNTHQDYKGLPVVPVAVNLRTYVGIIEKRLDSFKVHSLTLLERGEEHIDEFSPKSPELAGGGWFGDYLRAVVKVINERVDRVPIGGELVIESDVPIGSGLASSAALEVAFAEFLNHYWGLNLDKVELAEICFRAENGVMGIPCGRLDQYSAALGSAILLYPKQPVKYEVLDMGDVNLVAVDSGIRHSTGSIHPVRQAELNQGLKALLAMDLPQRLRELLAETYDSVNWEKLSMEALKPYLPLLSDRPARRIAYTLMANESTRRALELLRRKSKDLTQLAQIINEQHELLRDLYDVSLPELERIRDAMLQSGALAAKISGAGMGGSLIALCSDEKSTDSALEAALRAGAVKGWRLRIDRGSSIDYPV
ncbi:MAG: galactokinase family protein [Nitrososphaerota archaeon]|nr:GHMP kinase [Candidatus Calditenuaceae archaeon]MDW8073157.1 galactokinase family protein [Nitrososphaerota archaeon]